MKFCKVYKFADDPNLLHFNSSIKKLNRLVNVGMKHQSILLNASKIYLKVQKTELMIFKQKRKILKAEQEETPTPIVKYLGVEIDESLNWYHHINDAAIKLNRTHDLLFEIRNYVKQKVLRPIYLQCLILI